MTKVQKSLLLAFGAFAVSACSTVINGPETAVSVQEAHPISVDSQSVTLTLSQAASADGLSSLDTARLKAFAAAYMEKGHGPVTFSTSTDGADRLVGEAQQVLYDAGVPRRAMQTAAYAATANGADDVILSYTHYVATPSACGVWKGLRFNDYKNLRSPNFGCATQNNLAAMVSDPLDLVRAADMTAPDAAIRIRGVNAFREGEITSSQTDTEIETKVSE